MEIADEHVRRTFLPDIPNPKLRLASHSFWGFVTWWFVCDLLWVCCCVKHQADCEKEEHLRTTGTNEPVLIETHPCDADLAKIPTPGLNTSQKKVPLTILLNVLFLLDNVNGIGLKNTIFWRKNLTYTLEIDLAMRRARIGMRGLVLWWKLMLLVWMGIRTVVYGYFGLSEVAVWCWGCEFSEISRSPASQKRDPAKRCSFVPAVSERSLRSSKRNGWSRA